MLCVPLNLSIMCLIARTAIPRSERLLKVVLRSVKVNLNNSLGRVSKALSAGRKGDSLAHIASHQEVAYSADPCVLYERLRGLGGAVLLDSGSTGRWDIVAAAPAKEQSLHISSSTCTTDADSRLRLLKARAVEVTVPAKGLATEIPFWGGYIGHLSYELGRRLHGFDASSQGALPLASVHYYPWAVVQDRHTRTAYIVSDGSVSTVTLENVQQRLFEEQSPKSHNTDSFQITSEFSHPWQLSAYEAVFSRVKAYISAGDCYQINIGQDFTASYSGDLWQAYKRLRSVTDAPYSAFFPLTAEHAFLSFSPERFLEIKEGRVSTKPIKGTRPRSLDQEADRAAAKALLASEKERAENLMIVDLLRNDIGRYCNAGSVAVDELFKLESYKTVHHLVSTVSGALRSDCHAMDLLLGCLPGGSITGAPKHRAMQIIDELEIKPRQAWCGSIFYLSAHGHMDSNIAIRSLYNDGDKLHCWAGGGLVDDSVADEEFAEQRHKVGAILETLQSYSGVVGER